ncbi:MMPL family transporter [Lactococcus nasutitermitis]|uniref:MMPL family transporter n=1 Tax=Lactococcus nasutitermitis TaxID=1652957 RepID=A0ABV9JBK2_9LACT|nr:MMPL family transporter [Lactococcus nasutitermitis]
MIPKSGPSALSTQRLVQRLRKTSLESSLAGKPKLEVSGQTAVNIDVSKRLANALPLYLLLVVGFAFILLAVVFRSLLVPLKAVLSFLLSLGAALGSTVAVYQWGWLGKLFGVDPASPILCFLPIIVIGVLFGLSMDYEIFLVSGMRERVVLGDEAHTAIHSGFALGAKVVAAAALIMIGVFGSGIFTSASTTKPIAFALAVGVLVDAFVVRMIILPAVMALFGKSAWWFPHWLDKILPKITIE